MTDGQIETTLREEAEADLRKLQMRRIQLEARLADLRLPLELQLRQVRTEIKALRNAVDVDWSE
jgi:hypothetical protein